MSTHLGKITFLDTPDVNGSNVLTKADLTNLVIPGTEGFVMPSGTTAQRPVSPVLGEQRYNTSLLEPEIWSNGAWLPGSRVIQVASGQITGINATVAAKNLTATGTVAPTSTEGIQLFTTSFTPLVVGSTLVVQYTITAYSTSARFLMSSAYVGTTCIGTIGNSVLAASNTGNTAGHVNLALQVVYTTTSTTAVTIQGRLQHAMTGNTTNALIGFNQIASTAATLGSALATEWRILEMIP